MSRRHWPWCLVIAISIIAAGLAVFFFGKYASGKNRAQAMYAVLVSLIAYSDAHGQMPDSVVDGDSGEGLFSWRLSIIPYTPMDGPVFRRFDRARRWDNGVNAAIAAQRPWIYCFTPNTTVTNVFGVIGAGTAFDGRSRRAMTDCPRDLIVILEVVESSVPWSAPGDVDPTQLTADSLQGPNRDGIHVGFADLSVWHLSPDVPVELVRRFMTIDSAKRHSRNDELSRYAVRRYWAE